MPLIKLEGVGCTDRILSFNSIQKRNYLTLVYEAVVLMNPVILAYNF
jgi:hypothetical protein